MCPHICKYIHAPQKNRKRKKNLTTKQKAKDIFPEARKNGTDSGSTNGTGGSGGTGGGVGGKYRLGLIGPSQWTSAVHELSASSTKQAKESTLSPHTNGQWINKSKGLTQSYAAEPGRQSQHTDTK